MKILIAEDDLTNSVLLQEMLKRFGLLNLAVNGRQAVEAVRASLDQGKPFDLICLDIMMPGMDGHQVLREIRTLEILRGIPPANRVRVIMTTALEDYRNVVHAYLSMCDGYVSKPIRKKDLIGELLLLGLIP